MIAVQSGWQTRLANGHVPAQTESQITGTLHLWLFQRKLLQRFIARGLMIGQKKGSWGVSFGVA
jgi:hypothetical protein